MARPYNRRPVEAAKPAEPAVARDPEPKPAPVEFSEGLAPKHCHLAYNGTVLTFRAGQLFHADRALRDALDVAGAAIQWGDE